MSQKFKCRYELDQRLDKDLVSLTQRTYRTIQELLYPQYELRLIDGLPDAVEYYLLYSAVLIFGAADAALTLVLHNLGREARLFERQVFECWARATFYAKNPDEARKALYSTAFQEKRILDGLQYPKDSTRYKDLEEMCKTIAGRFPDTIRYREPTLKDILLSGSDPDMEKFYTWHYRVPSQMAHATVVGVGGVWDARGISFDSRLSDPNMILANLIVFVLAFLRLLNEHMATQSLGQIILLEDEWQKVQRHLKSA